MSVSLPKLELLGQPKLAVEVWSDIACPWCYIGKRHLEAALEKFPHPVEVTWRAFELDTRAPKVRDPASYAERLAKKYGMSVDRAQAKIDEMTRTAAADGLDFRFDRIQPGNTFDAHRVIHLAKERGLGDAVKERFLLGYMTEGEAIGEPEVLIRLATDAGLDAAEVRAVLDSDTYAKEVRFEEDQARSFGITGVPFFVIDQRFGVSGAQPAEVLRQVLEKAWAERPEDEIADGMACGPDGC